MGTSAPVTAPPATVETDPETVPDTVPETIGETDPETKAETAPETVPETIPLSPDGGTSAKGFPITEENGVTYVGGILIANKTYGLPETYAPGHLITECYQAFLKMVQAAKKSLI